MTRRVTVNLVARAATAQRRRDQTRERLIDAAETVVAEKGVETASIEDFVRAAGVSRGTFYNYFPTATDIVHAMNTRWPTMPSSMPRATWPRRCTPFWSPFRPIPSGGGYPCNSPRPARPGKSPSSSG
jgi:hypothetical protein